MQGPARAWVASTPAVALTSIRPVGFSYAGVLPHFCPRSLLHVCLLLRRQTTIGRLRRPSATLTMWCWKWAHPMVRTADSLLRRWLGLD